MHSMISWFTKSALSRVHDSSTDSSIFSPGLLRIRSFLLSLFVMLCDEKWAGYQWWCPGWLEFHTVERSCGKALIANESLVVLKSLKKFEWTLNPKSANQNFSKEPHCWCSNLRRSHRTDQFSDFNWEISNWSWRNWIPNSNFKFFEKGRHFVSSRIFNENFSWKKHRLSIEIAISKLYSKFFNLNSSIEILKQNVLLFEIRFSHDYSQWHTDNELLTWTHLRQDVAAFNLKKERSSVVSNKKLFTRIKH